MSRIDELLREIKTLEPLPSIALRVIHLAADEETTPRELVALIETDVALTARVLKLANSAYYGFAREIGSIYEAGNLLGTSALSNLSLTSCAARFFRGGSGGDLERRQRAWEVAIAQALSAQLLARAHGRTEASRAYTAALLQDVGIQVLERCAFADVVRLELRELAPSERLAEDERLFGAHHAEIGARLLERWRFPDPIVDAVRWHHDPTRAELDPLLATFVGLSDEIRRRLEEDQRGRDGKSRTPDEMYAAEAALENVDLDAFARLLAPELERARSFAHS